MLEKLFNEVYSKFKLNFYRQVFQRFETREASLTAVETFCVEVIYIMGSPTVNEFAKFVRISQANAAYKVQNLIKKGYVKKNQSPEDKREFFLTVTDKFYQYYGVNLEYVSKVTKRIENRFSQEEIGVFNRILEAISRELMPEVEINA